MHLHIRSRVDTLSVFKSLLDYLFIYLYGLVCEKEKKLVGDTKTIYSIFGYNIEYRFTYCVYNRCMDSSK